LDVDNILHQSWQNFGDFLIFCARDRHQADEDMLEQAIQAAQAADVDDEVR